MPDPFDPNRPIPVRTDPTPIIPGPGPAPGPAPVLPVPGRPTPIDQPVPVDRYSPADRAFMAPRRQEIAIASPNVELVRGHTWAWKESRLSNLLAGEFRRQGLPKELLLVPVEGLKEKELDRLGKGKLSRGATQQLYQEVRATAERLKQMGTRYRDPALTKAGTLAQRLLATMPARLDTASAKALFDTMNRLASAHELANARSVVATIANADSLQMITETWFSFTHDAQNMRGNEPAGYRLYLSTTPPPTSPPYTGFAKMIDFGMIEKDPVANEYGAHFVEAQSDLDPTVQYHVWMTAYNSHGESNPSTPPLQKDFPEAIRGDLNHDGQLDVQDVNIMMRLLLDGKTPRVLADVNMDGLQTQDDLVALLERIENG